jgi:hypothetical protein
VAGGGDVDRLAYDPLLSRLASFGFVVASPRQCSMGCLEDCKTLDGDPPCFGRYYHQQLDVFSWARNYSSADSRNVSGSPADVLSRVNHSMGYGVAGHSMGGQATLFSSSFHNASEQHIKAAVMHQCVCASLGLWTMRLPEAAERECRVSLVQRLLEIAVARAGRARPRLHGREGRYRAPQVDTQVL